MIRPAPALSPAQDRRSPLRVPATILTGFLGAGKTTLLNRVLRESHGLRIGVVVNDFGSINIDERLVVDIEGNTIGLSNGCVCCDMRGDLVRNVRLMLDRPEPPNYLLIEASGVADPIGIASTFRTSVMRERTQLSAVVTLVDSEHARDPRLDRQLVEDQIRAADIAVLNKVDLVDKETKEDVRVWLSRLAPRVRIVEAVHADIPLDLVLATDPGRSPLSLLDHPVSSSGGALHRFETWSYATDQPLAYRKVLEALRGLPPDVYRAKGVVRVADVPNLAFAAQVVGGRVSIDVIGPWNEPSPLTELVFIGAPGAVMQSDLAVCLDACVTPVFPLMPRENFRALRARVASSGIRHISTR